MQTEFWSGTVAVQIHQERFVEAALCPVIMREKEGQRTMFTRL